MNWREYFLSGEGVDQEEMFQAFRERINAEENGESLYDEPVSKKEKEEMKRQQEYDEQYSEHLKNEHYRKQYAIQKGYKFKPKEFVFKRR